MFYEQLLHAQIPKLQKDGPVVNLFFALLGSAGVKAARRMLMKLKPVHILTNILQVAFVCSNALALSFYFTNYNLPNYTNTFNSKFLPTFMLYALHCTPVRSSTGAKAVLRTLMCQFHTQFNMHYKVKL